MTREALWGRGEGDKEDATLLKRQREEKAMNDLVLVPICEPCVWPCLSVFANVSICVFVFVQLCDCLCVVVSVHPSLATCSFLSLLSFLSFPSFSLFSLFACSTHFTILPHQPDTRAQLVVLYSNAEYFTCLRLGYEGLLAADGLHPTNRGWLSRHPILRVRR